jgi:hypothetical protein
VRSDAAIAVQLAKIEKALHPVTDRGAAFTGLSRGAERQRANGSESDSDGGDLLEYTGYPPMIAK